MTLACRNSPLRLMRIGAPILAALLACAGTRAWAVPTCSMSTAATLEFGSVVALASTPDQTANSGSSFWVSCTSDVSSTPKLYSATSPRVLVSGNASLPMSLSLIAPGGPELPDGYPGAAISITKNGTAQTVTLHGKVRSTDFRGLPSGVYTATLFLTIEY